MKGNVKIEIFHSVHTVQLQRTVNEFISDKKVIDIRTNTNFIGSEYVDTTEITITVIYEDII